MDITNMSKEEILNLVNTGLEKGWFSMIRNNKLIFYSFAG